MLVAMLAGGSEDIDLSGRNQAVANSSSHLLSAPQPLLVCWGLVPSNEVTPSFTSS